MTAFRDGTELWHTIGDFGCSNGVPICSLSFSVNLQNDELSLPFEILDEEVENGKFLVVPVFSQYAYKGDGLRVSWIVQPDDTTFAVPVNVYRQTECFSPFKSPFVFKAEGREVMSVRLDWTYGAEPDVYYRYSGLPEEYECQAKASDLPNQFDVTCEDSKRSGVLKFVNGISPDTEKLGFYWKDQWFEQKKPN